MLARLKGIGPETAAVLWSESLFRQFNNRRQVAAYAGLAPTPWQRGSIDHEQGVSKAGNPRLRSAVHRALRFLSKYSPASAFPLQKSDGTHIHAPCILKKTATFREDRAMTTDTARTQRRHVRDEATIDHLVQGVYQPKDADQKQTVRSPTTSTGLSIEDQVRKEWDSSKMGGLPTF